MNVINNNQWVSEISEGSGTAFSFALKAQLHEETTPYQHIAIYDTTHFGKLMTIDGFVMLTTRDNFLYHEMMSHPILYTHPNPQDVVIIGGGDCGTLREVLRHTTVKSAIQIDIDERVTALALEHFPELCESNDDPRAQLLFQDGIQWMAAAPTASADIIIVDSTDPLGPGEGLFTVAFYQECLRVLRKDGLLVQQSESPLIHQTIIKDMHGAMKQAGFHHQQLLHFPQPVYPSGWWSATLTTKGTHYPEYRKHDPQTFPTQYYSAAMHQAALVNPPFVEKMLGK